MAKEYAQSGVDYEKIEPFKQGIRFWWIVNFVPFLPKK